MINRRSGAGLVLYIDGASKGNPGPAGIGIVVTDQEGTVITEIGKSIGTATNNVAEYKALIRGLEEAAAQGAHSVAVHTDSQLLVRQMLGQYKINAPHLQSLQQEAQTLCSFFPGRITMTHIPREGNKRADQLANEGVRSAVADAE